MQSEPSVQSGMTSCTSCSTLLKEAVNQTCSSGANLERLNQHCFCISLQDGAMQQAVQDELAAPEILI